MGPEIELADDQPDDDVNDEPDPPSAKAELARRRDVNHQNGHDDSDKRPATRDRFCTSPLPASATLIHN